MFLDWANDIMEISSTEVRNMLNEYYENNSNDVLVKLKKYVDPKVLKYIFKNRLYEDTKRNDKSNL
jgi:nicotinic acid mononucleotide adenylyltransferase